MPKLKAREPDARYARQSVGGSMPPLRALLAVNVLIALLDADHLHHLRASTWLADNLASGWASCALTENGCIRIMSQPGYPNALPAARIAERLRQATRTAHHRFIDQAPSLLNDEWFDTEQLLGHRQVTDAWLLGLAVAHDLRLVTFDRSVAMRIVRQATDDHLLAL